MKVKDLVQQLQGVENQDMEVFIERASHKNRKAKGVYLVFVPVDAEELPNNCVIVEAE